MLFRTLIGTACVAVLVIAGLQVWGVVRSHDLEDAERARCMSKLDTVLKDDGSLSPDQRRALQDSFDRCASDGIISGADVQAYVAADAAK